MLKEMSLNKEFVFKFFGIFLILYFKALTIWIIKYKREKKIFYVFRLERCE